MKNYFLMGLLFLCTGCTNSKTKLEYALHSARENRPEIEKVIGHYAYGTLPYKSAVFLVENTTFRLSYAGELIDIYRDSVGQWNGKADLNGIWNKIAIEQYLEPEQQQDIRKIRAEYLIRNIDQAFRAWEEAPWKDSLSFDLFKEYILPYAVGDEPLTEWRDVLRKRYLPVIRGIDSPKEAFDRLYTHIVRNFKLVDGSDFSVIADPLTVHRTLRGTCSTRSMYIVYAARSLAIPAAYEYVDFWANYSNVSHSWAAYIDSDHAPYVVFDRDTVSVKGGIIDASYFPKTAAFDDTDTSFHIDSLKRAARIKRIGFSVNRKTRPQVDFNDPEHLRGVYFTDVSPFYGLNHTLSVKINKAVHDKIYLCNYITGQGWIPVDGSAQSGKTITFDHLDGDIVYLPARLENREVIPLTNPVILGSEHSQRVLNPDLQRRQTVTLWRKYPLQTRWLPNRWEKYIGVVFEGSNDPLFSRTDTLHRIEEIPLGITEVNLDNDKDYRYIRVHPRSNSRLRMSEAAFYGVNQAGGEVEITGELICHNIPEENARKLFDKDYLTAISARQNYYWVGLDLGADTKSVVTRIRYCPENDGNLIEPGDTYELFYYDMEWHSLGRQTAEKNYLSYGQVPENALLWLSNLSKGKEERVFTYENGKQVFW